MKIEFIFHIQMCFLLQAIVKLQNAFEKLKYRLITAVSVV